jgi:Zn-dependent M28 family amino/carboxypeptidase
MIDRTALWALVLPLLLACTFAAHAAEAERPEAVADSLSRRAAADGWSYKFLEGLTSEIGPRLAGTEAEARAADWAAARLRSAGMDVHLETFPMTAWERGVETAAIVTPAPQRLILTALGGSVATPPEGIEAEVVVFRTYAALLAAPLGSLTGKIAVVTERMVRTMNGEGYGANFRIRHDGPSEAARRGATAYLHRSLGTDTHRLPHTGALAYAEGAPRIPAAALAGPDADQLERLTALGPVTVHVTLTPTERRDAQSVTVVGEIEGRDKPDEIVLIGAHLDSWDLGTGAIDDGAGDAIVAGVGRLIAALPQHPRRTVRIVLFGAEEMDYSGAAYAKAHTAEADKIVVAGETDFGARRIYAVELPPGAVESPFGTALADILPAQGALMSREPARHGGSDIEGLRLGGVPVLSMSQNGLDYFDVHHTADDTLDKVDPAELAQNVAIWAATAYLAAETAVDFRTATSRPPAGVPTH